MLAADDNIILVQPYCECNSTDCVLKSKDAEIELCALRLPLTFQQWLNLLTKHDGLDGSVYVISAGCPRAPDSTDELLERTETYCVYRARKASQAAGGI